MCSADRYRSKVDLPGMESNFPLVSTPLLYCTDSWHDRYCHVTCHVTSHYSNVEDVNDELEVLVYKAKSEHLIGKVKLPLHRVSPSNY